MRIIDIFKRKRKITIHMKSGAAIRIKAHNITIKKNGNDLLGYEITGAGEKLFYVRLDDISAITLDK